MILLVTLGEGAFAPISIGLYYDAIVSDNLRLHLRLEASSSLPSRMSASHGFLSAYAAIRLSETLANALQIISPEPQKF